MKKQIFILTFLSLAFLFAGVKSYGQTALSPGITATQPIDPLTCADPSVLLPLHPFPGVSYTYSMTGVAGAEQPDTWTWFATKDPNFITTTGGVTTLNTANALTVAPGKLLAFSSSTNTVTITWSAEILAATEYQGDATNWATASSTNPTPTFVVGYATGENCADNIQVYEINPRFNFVIDIANISPLTLGTLDWDEVTEQCVDDVQRAVYNSGSNEIDMDYGTNTLYFEVAAANFVKDWTPTFQLVSGLVGDQTAVVTLHPSLADAQGGTLVSATANWTAATVGTAWAPDVQYTAADPDDVVNGVSLFVKVVISNLTEESLTDNDFVLAVDAIDDTKTGMWDMGPGDCADPVVNGIDQDDEATHTVTPRPTIIMNPTMPDATPAPDDVIIKTDPTP